LKLLLTLIFFISQLTLLFGQKLLIPMDISQKNHLKAYGLTFWALEANMEIEWLLNYHGGSFLMDYSDKLARECRIRGVNYQSLDAGTILNIYAEIEANNMEIILLEKAPKIAVYTPPNKQPWDDAVTLALEYAEIPYDKLWDREVLKGDLSKYDWLHLHHEDFTGQYGKFYASYHGASWYIRQQLQYENMAAELGYQSVSEEKKSVARTIKDYIRSGGFLFAMCSATDSYDIALAAEGIDIADVPFDMTGVSPDLNTKLDYSKTLVFKDFTLVTNPLVYEFSDIDAVPGSGAATRQIDTDYFSLFEFSAKHDPVPTMLTQNHVGVIKGFMGQTTSFRKHLIKDHIIIMGEVESANEVKYLHGNFGRGTFTFLGGHDPEDPRHLVNDPPTNLELHPNSPGYRLILNNILFPAARKKPQKT